MDGESQKYKLKRNVLLDANRGIFTMTYLLKRSLVTGYNVSKLGQKGAIDGQEDLYSKAD